LDVALAKVSTTSFLRMRNRNDVKCIEKIDDLPYLLWIALKARGKTMYIIICLSDNHF
jgi:hypothetical protein